MTKGALLCRQGDDGLAAATLAAGGALATLVPVIRNPADAEAHGFDRDFPGLYAARIPPNCTTGKPWHCAARCGALLHVSGSVWYCGKASSGTCALMHHQRCGLVSPQ